MSALPNASGLKYFDNSNSTPAPQGVQVPFNQEDQDVWIGYDSATGQICITNFSRTATIVCFSTPAPVVGVCGQFYRSSVQNLAPVPPGGTIITFAGVQGQTPGVALSGTTKIKIPTAGKYRIEWKINVQSEQLP